MDFDNDERLSTAELIGNGLLGCYVLPFPAK